MNTTLLVLAGGMGSRYGGLKQLDEVGPCGETIVDYSVFDALRAGFDKVVFVVQQSTVEKFRNRYSAKLADQVEVQFVVQPVSPDIPGVGVVPRSKPWGTAHAVLVAKDAIDGPFAVINADDYYGVEAFATMHEHLLANVATDRYALVGFELEKTLSLHGSVSRAICETDSANKLTSIVERTQIIRQGDAIVDQSVNPSVVLSAGDLVSMNFWGFDVSFFSAIADSFVQFASDNRTRQKAELYIPSVVDQLINEGSVSVDVLASGEQWFGLTYADDKADLVRAMLTLSESSLYPSPLW